MIWKSFSEIYHLKAYDIVNGKQYLKANDSNRLSAAVSGFKFSETYHLKAYGIMNGKQYLKAKDSNRLSAAVSGFKLGFRIMCVDGSDKNVPSCQVPSSRHKIANPSTFSQIT